MPKLFIAKFRLALVATAVLILAAACHHRLTDSDLKVNGTGGINAAHQLDKPYLVLVSIDSFRWDYLDHYATPNLHRITNAGSRAERLLPVFPSLTFPNHYSIATGLYPAHHGLVSNDFPDPLRNKWYSLKDKSAVADPGFYDGEPIWVTAESQGMVAASMFFVGSEAPVKGIQPTHWRRYDGSMPGEDRVDQVLSWLALPAETRPHLYMLYFEEVDSYSHWYGPDSAENAGMIRQVDAYIGRLLDGLERLPHGDQVNIIVVSDHGQTTYNTEEPPFVLSDYIYTGHAPLVGGGSYLFIHLPDEDLRRADEFTATVNHNWNHGRAYTRDSAPPEWHVTDNPRFPDIILMPEPGYAVIPVAGGKPLAGDHGWAPEAPAMHGFFIASGPNIKPGVSLGPVSMVDVYPLMTAILGLDAPAGIDGDPRKLADTLYKNTE